MLVADGRAGFCSPHYLDIARLIHLEECEEELRGGAIDDESEEHHAPREEHELEDKTRHEEEDDKHVRMTRGQRIFEAQGMHSLRLHVEANAHLELQVRFFKAP